MEGTRAILSKRRFVKVNESVFVNEIKKRPILFNIMHKDYKRITLRNEAWNDVALAMHLSTQECKRRWRSMRDAFLKILRTKRDEDRKKWIHYRLLEFLLPYTRIGIENSTQQNASDNFNQSSNCNDFDCLDIDSDLDLYGDGPITVSYMTEGGKEIFQILHRPNDADLLESEPEEDEQEEQFEEIESEGTLTSLLRFRREVLDAGQQQRQEQDQQSQDVEYLVTSEVEYGSETESVLYEERIDSTMLDFGNKIESNIELDSTWAKETELSHEKGECYESADEVIHPMEKDMSDLVPKRRKMETQERLLPEYKKNVTPAPSTAPTPTSSPAPCEESRKPVNNESDARLGITDQDERFLMSCAPILRRLPNKKNLLARVRIQQMLYELEYDEKYDGQQT